MTRASVGVLLAFGAVLATSVSSAAAPPARNATPAAPRPRAPASPPPLPLPAAQVTLKVTPGSGGGPWTLKVENAGDVPVRIPANARLLSLELTPPAPTPAAGEAAPDPKKKRTAAAAAAAGPLKCVLPDDARPSNDEGSELVLPSKRSWSSSFDPLFYCFGVRERAALVTGTSVRARFGWPIATAARAGAAHTATAPPFAVTPVGAGVGKVDSAKAIEADAFTLTEAVSITSAAAASASFSSSSSGDGNSEDSSSPVTLSMPEAMDVTRGIEIGTTVTLTNGGDRPITLLYRPEMLLFTVSTPAGSVSCGLARQIASPIRELFTTVPVKGKVELGVLVTALCPADTFDEPGVYRVLPRIDTTGASGRGVGLKTWEGTSAGKRPLLVRVRNPRKPGLPARPTLD